MTAPRRKRSPDKRTGDRHKGTPGVLVRAPAAEIAAWRDAAADSGVTLTAWLRSAAADAMPLRRAPVWADAPCDCGRGKRGHACPPHAGA